ncbi:hypothetical protein PHISCL_05580 [Aspergillus sclerotialis]|uniref:Uncharacterized protein n=1 Tax=Aspergillus sclerotialis TaxID=2070753 RepID=A0A3A2ZRZ7_9EURO|nr:hypothetical protein PHISCL_05580 [Aspergillus sclerotialis]
MARTSATANQASADHITALQARNQGTNLPHTWDGKLQNLEKLTKKEGFSAWEFRIKAILDDESLGDVIDPALPRPHYTDSKHYIWRKTSTKIAKWLSIQISDELLDEVIAIGTNSIYADDFYKAVEKAVLGSPMSAFYTVIYMIRSDHKTIDQYVTAFRQSTEYSIRLGMPFTAFQSMLLVLHGVKQELQEYVALKIASFKDDVSETMKWSDFMQLCKEIKDKAMFI